MLKSEIIDAVVELIQDANPAMRANVARWVNFVLDDIASRGLLKSLQREEECTLIAGNGTSSNMGRNYDLADDTDQIYKVFVESWGSDGILRRYTDENFLKRMLCDGATTRGKPEIYCIFSYQTLRIHPIPSSDWAPSSPTSAQKLKVWKYKSIRHLTESETITEIKMKHIPVIVGGAYAFGARFDDHADLEMTMGQYEAGVRRVFFDNNHDLDRPSQTSYNDT